jgi:hypothetical protein
MPFFSLSDYEKRCRCNESVSITTKKNSITRREGRPLAYPIFNKLRSKTFQIKSYDQLSFTGKFVLNSFQNKYLYYAIDDILYTFKASPMERDHLLEILYSPVLSLQNNFSVNFFDIWIREVYIEEISKPNKFLSPDSEVFTKVTQITIQFFYKTKMPGKKKESLW